MIRCCYEYGTVLFKICQCFMLNFIALQSLISNSVRTVGFSMLATFLTIHISTCHIKMYTHTIWFDVWMISKFDNNSVWHENIHQLQHLIHRSEFGRRSNVACVSTVFAYFVPKNVLHISLCTVYPTLHNMISEPLHLHCYIITNICMDFFNSILFS